MPMTQRKNPPCSNLIVWVDLLRPKGGQKEYTYHCLQCRQRSASVKRGRNDGEMPTAPNERLC